MKLVRALKYPTLPEKKDLRRKLMSKDIEEIQADFERYGPFPSRSVLMKLRSQGKDIMSESQWMSGMAETYGVSSHTIYYYIHADYREYKKKLNAKAHNKHRDLEDYKKHRAREIKNRASRIKRHAALKEYTYRVNAKNEKRSVRKTVLGKPLHKRVH